MICEKCGSEMTLIQNTIWLCPCGAEKMQNKGLGDVVADVIEAATFGLLKPCSACEKRKQWLNRLGKKMNDGGQSA